MLSCDYLYRGVSPLLFTFDVQKKDNSLFQKKAKNNSSKETLFQEIGGHCQKEAKHCFAQGSCVGLVIQSLGDPIWECKMFAEWSNIQLSGGGHR